LQSFAAKIFLNIFFRHSSSSFIFFCVVVLLSFHTAHHCVVLCNNYNNKNSIKTMATAATEIYVDTISPSLDFWFIKAHTKLV
jgi:hypothetical protein